jgi:hypothetical protein
MWKQLIFNGMETNYEVSTEGHIRNKYNKNVLSEALAKGYLRVCVHLPDGTGKNKQMSYPVHRMVAYVFLPNDDPVYKTQVDHLNGNKLDNRVYNLEWVTPKENVIRAHKNGLCHVRYGENHPNNVYTEEQVRKVCELLEENKLTLEEIGKRCGMPRKIVQKIKGGTLWVHVSKDYKIPATKELRDFSMYHQFILEMLKKGMSYKDIMPYKPADVKKEGWRCLIKYLKKKLKAEGSTTRA